MARIEKENGEQWSDNDKACVVQTLASIAADISGNHILVTDQELLFRAQQLAKQEHFHRGHPTVPFHTRQQLDHRQVRKYIQKIIENETPTGKVLQQCDIYYINGTADDIPKFIKRGYSIGVCIKLSHTMHMFHVSVDHDGTFYDKSDTNTPIFMTKKSRHLNEFIQSGQVENSWNMILIRPKQNSTSIKRAA